VICTHDKAYLSLSVDIEPLSSSLASQTTTKADQKVLNNAPQRAIEIPLGVYTGAALSFLSLEVLELKDMGVL
jgi:hypothetical protein